MESPPLKYTMPQEAKAISPLGGGKNPPKHQKTKTHHRLSHQSNPSSRPRIRDKLKPKHQLKCITHQEESQTSVLGDELYNPQKNLILNNHIELSNHDFIRRSPPWNIGASINFTHFPFK